MNKVLHIGIFWIYKFQIYLKSIQADIVKPIDGFIDSDFAHYKYGMRYLLKTKIFIFMSMKIFLEVELFMTLKIDTTLSTLTMSLLTQKKLKI